MPMPMKRVEIRMTVSIAMYIAIKREETPFFAFTSFFSAFIFLHFLLVICCLSGLQDLAALWFVFVSFCYFVTVTLIELLRLCACQLAVIVAVWLVFPVIEFGGL